jgi:hypothetical protein
MQFPAHQSEKPKRGIGDIARTGAIGALIGGGIGAGKTLLSPPTSRRKGKTPDYLRNTLAGALIGGVGGGGLKALGAMEPWEREQPMAKAWEAVGTTADEIKSNPALLLTASPNELLDRLKGNVSRAMEGAKGDVTPTEQQDMTDYLLTANLPSSEGFKNRVSHLENLVGQLAQGGGTDTLYNLAVARKFTADPQTSAMLAQAEKTIKAMGQAGRPLSDLQTKGQMSELDVARRVGLLTGRFGKGNTDVRSMVERITKGMDVL